MIERASIASIRKTQTENPKPSRTAPTNPNFKLGAEFWPPVANKPYPDLTLYDHRGNIVKLSKIARDRVVLLEPIGMTCQACQAFSGGHKYGPFKGVTPQENLESIEKYLSQYARGLEIQNPKIVYVQLILFDMDMKAPSVESVKEWARHYRFGGRQNTYVLAGTPEMVGDVSYDMIPGFHLIDRNFVFRGDSAGHQPKHNLWREVLPSIPVMMR